MLNLNELQWSQNKSYSQVPNINHHKENYRFFVILLMNENPNSKKFTCMVKDEAWAFFLGFYFYIFNKHDKNQLRSQSY